MFLLSNRLCSISVSLSYCNCYFLFTNWLQCIYKYIYIYIYINNLPLVSDFKVTFPTISSSFVYDDINTAEVEQVKLFLPNSYSRSSDGLSSIILKKIIDCISFPLSKIFNKSVLESVAPSKLKIAKVIPNIENW